MPSFSAEALLESQAREGASDAGFPAMSPAKAAALARTVEGYRAPAPRPPRTPAPRRPRPQQGMLEKPCISAPPAATAKQPICAVHDEIAAVRETVTERVPVPRAASALLQTVQRRSSVESASPEAAAAPDSSQPVLVLEIDDDESERGVELRFARLQARCNIAAPIYLPISKPTASDEGCCSGEACPTGERCKSCF